MEHHTIDAISMTVIVYGIVIIAGTYTLEKIGVVG